MSPRPKVYETEEERKEAHRRRQAKYRLKKKLEKLEQIERDEERQRIAEMSRVVMKSAEKQKSSIDSGDRQEHHVACEWCGCLMGNREGLHRRCNFCRQFNSREEMLAEKKWHHTERLLKKMGDYDLIRKLKTEFRQAWKCGRCGTLNPYYKQNCEVCHGPREGTLIVKGGKLDSDWDKRGR